IGSPHSGFIAQASRIAIETRWGLLRTRPAVVDMLPPPFGHMAIAHCKQPVSDQEVVPGCKQLVVRELESLVNVLLRLVRIVPEAQIRVSLIVVHLCRLKAEPDRFLILSDYLLTQSEDFLPGRGDVA